MRRHSSLTLGRGLLQAHGGIPTLREETPGGDTFGFVPTFESDWYV